MKLGELKTAIRTLKGNPTVATLLPDGTEIWVRVQKTSFMGEIDGSFANKNSETGMMLDGDRITVEGERVPASEEEIDISPAEEEIDTPPAEEEIDIDLDDL